MSSTHDRKRIKLTRVSVSVSVGLQEVMRCLEVTQQLLLSQTQALSRVELELQTQREQYQVSGLNVRVQKNVTNMYSRGLSSKL